MRGGGILAPAHLSPKEFRAAGLRIGHNNRTETCYMYYVCLYLYYSIYYTVARDCILLLCGSVAISTMPLEGTIYHGRTWWNVDDDTLAVCLPRGHMPPPNG